MCDLAPTPYADAGELSRLCLLAAGHRQRHLVFGAMHAERPLRPVVTANALTGLRAGRDRGMELRACGRLDGHLPAPGDFVLLRNVCIGRRRSRRQHEARGDERRLREGLKIKSEHLLLHEIQGTGGVGRLGRDGPAR
jgi:hypothetical protein